MQTARPDPHAPKQREGEGRGTGGADVDGGVGQSIPHKSASLQVRGLVGWLLVCCHLDGLFIGSSVVRYVADGFHC